MAGRGVSPIAVGTLATGVLLVWAGLKGASVLKTVQEVIQGKKPSGTQVYPIGQAAATSSTGPGKSSGSALSGPDVVPPPTIPALPRITPKVPNPIVAPPRPPGSQSPAPYYPNTTIQQAPKPKPSWQNLWGLLS